MPTHVALLRGINVGGRNRVAMADLREVVTSLGHTDVATYIQSGNVVFTTPEADTGPLAAALERAIAETLGVRPRVVVVSRHELSQVIADNPYPCATPADPTARRDCHSAPNCSQNVPQAAIWFRMALPGRKCDCEYRYSRAKIRLSGRQVHPHGLRGVTAGRA